MSTKLILGKHALLSSYYRSLNFQNPCLLNSRHKINFTTVISLETSKKSAMVELYVVK